MSSILPGRLWSYPLFVLAMLLSLLGFVPAAQADPVTSDNESFMLTYNCLKGQTLVVDPGQFRVKLMDESGNTVGYAEIKSAGIYMHPVAEFSSEGQRTQVQWYPGTETSFQQEAGLPVNDYKVLWIRTALEWTDETGVPEYLPSQVTCAGEPTDTDGDGVPDELDQCPALAGNGSSDGCPGGAVINVTNVQGGRSADGQPGSVTLTVTNPADSGGSESYDVGVGGGGSTTPPLADGETSTPMTFQAMPGEHQACATSDLTGRTTCAPVTVPDDPQPANTGTVAFTQTCTHLSWTVTNTGWKTSVYNSRSVSPEYKDNVYSWTLAPGQSRSGTTPNYAVGTTVNVRVYTENGVEAPNPDLGTAKWMQPSGCTPPMSGGDQVIRWGKVTRHVATPKVTIRTKAYSAHYGYQVKGRKRIVWFSSNVHPGTHKLRVNTLKIPRHDKRKVRLWVEYTGVGGHVGFGKHAFTGWHVYKRP